MSKLDLRGVVPDSSTEQWWNDYADQSVSHTRWSVTDPEAGLSDMFLADLSPAQSTARGSTRPEENHEDPS